MTKSSCALICCSLSVLRCIKTHFLFQSQRAIVQQRIILIFCVLTTFMTKSVSDATGLLISWEANRYCKKWLQTIKKYMQTEERSCVCIYKVFSNQQFNYYPDKSVQSLLDRWSSPASISFSQCLSVWSHLGGVWARHASLGVPLQLKKFQTTFLNVKTSLMHPSHNKK